MPTTAKRPVSVPAYPISFHTLPGLNGCYAQDRLGNSVAMRDLSIAAQDRARKELAKLNR